MLDKGAYRRQHAVELDRSLANGSLFTHQQSTPPKGIEPIIDGRSFVLRVIMCWIKDFNGCFGQERRVEQLQCTQKVSQLVVEVSHTRVDTGVERTVTMLDSHVRVFSLQQLCFTVLDESCQRDGNFIDCTTKQAQAQGMS